MAQTFLILCVSALLVQTISANCIGYGNYGGARILGSEIAAAELINAAALSNSAYGGCGTGFGAPIGASIYAPQVASASGGGLTVSSASPISPNGISVISENAIEGVLAVQGNLPLLAAVALEGGLPSAGAAGVSYSCGNGNVGISSESLAAAGLGAGAYGPANAGLYGGYGLANAGLAGTILGAEAAGINAGLAGSRLIGAGSPCGCSGIYY